MRTCSKTQKYLIAHNFFNFDHNIGMLHLKMIVLMRESQLNKNFGNLSYPLLTTIQNDEKLHIFDSNSFSMNCYRHCGLCLDYCNLKAYNLILNVSLAMILLLYLADYDAMASAEKHTCST